MGAGRQVRLSMKKILYLLVPFLLFCQDAYCGSDYSTSKTMYVGGNITLDPKTDCNASYVYHTSLGYDSEAFHVEYISHTNSLGFQNVNGSTTGTYSSYKLTALKPGIYTVSCVVQYFEISSGYNSKRNYATYTITVKEVPPAPQVVSITIPTVLSLSLGDVYSFSPIIYETGASTTLTWYSSNTSVATIENGQLNTTGIGTTTITCTAKNGVSAQCLVTVNPILVSGITLNNTEAELNIGGKLQLSATVSPNNATDKSVSWSSTNDAVAVVNEIGQVTGVNTGICQIKATANDGSGKTASCLVTVTESQSISLSALPTMTYGDASYALPQTTVEGLPLTWTSSNTSVATIGDNALTIVGAGTATVTATQAGNNSYQPFAREFTLTVNKAMLTITANDCTKQQGEANPALTVSYSGFKYSDTAASLTTHPTVTTTATTNSPVGTYPITPSGAASSNYEFTYVNGTLTVTAANTPPGTTDSESLILNVRQVSAGGDHTMILEVDGTLWGCGDNYYGELGDYDIGGSIPDQVMNGVAAVSAGYSYTMILDTDGLRR